jgi:ppGpp synthetase/RelA/SpoT-type nucleotidyltranferase
VPTLNRDDFLKKCQVSASDFRRTKLNWAQLEAIYSDHTAREPELLAAANYVRDRLQQIPAVHSLKLRIKDPAHLVEKIIRKRLERPGRAITAQNYARYVTDLIGVRALHLFKADWKQIHDVITTTWELNEQPVANVRRGDPDEGFREAGCRIKQHPAGYRSVHYIVRHQPARETQTVEVQVRTIFEEGWSEIDHRIRYPHNTDDEVLSQFLAIFNGLAGSADHMGSYIDFLAAEIELLRKQHALQSSQKANLRSEVRRLKSDVAKLQIDVKDKERLNERLRAVSASSAAETADPVGGFVDRFRTHSRFPAVPESGFGHLWPAHLTLEDLERIYQEMPGKTKR